jgi:hypothetical protein
VLLACVYYIVATPCYVLTNERVSWVRDRTEKAEDVRKRSTVIWGVYIQYYIQYYNPSNLPYQPAWEHERRASPVPRSPARHGVLAQIGSGLLWPKDLQPRGALCGRRAPLS